MNRAALALVLPLIAACQPVAVPVKPDPFDVHVPPECAQACICDVPPLPITQDPYSAVDAARFEHAKGAACVAQCDVRRKGCADALERARKAGVIR